MGSEGRECVDRLLSSEIVVALGRSVDKLSQEISARMQLIDRLQGALQRMQDGLERLQRDRSMPDSTHVPGFLTLDANAAIVEIDAPCATLLGEPAQRLLNRRFTCLVIPDEREHWGRVSSDALVGERT